MERKVGEQFKYGDITLEVVLNISCKGCYFNGCCSFPRKLIGHCSCFDRKDRNSIIFKEVKNMNKEIKEIILPDGFEVDKIEGGKIILKAKENELDSWKRCVNYLKDKESLEFIGNSSDIITLNCGRAIDSKDDRNIIPEGYGKVLLAFSQLLVCRNAWWKSVNWKPNWSGGTIKYCIGYALENCKDDIDFLAQMYDKNLVERLEFVLHNQFMRLPYTEAIKILEASGKKFEFPVSWGIDLQSEHERYLVEEHFKKPVILTDYPKEIKAFYMKLNDDGKTVRAMDVLFPQIGEIIGGSEREADYNKLLARIEELHIPMKDMWWYLDTRRFGTVPHSGFGLGFERLVLFVTGMTNIRDVIPFPRTPKNAEF